MEAYKHISEDGGCDGSAGGVLVPFFYKDRVQSDGLAGPLWALFYHTTLGRKRVCEHVSIQTIWTIKTVCVIKRSLVLCMHF
jgi:hypothetical protein